MLTAWLQFHQVDNVDHAYFQLRKLAAQQLGRSQRLKCRHIAATHRHPIWPFAQVSCPVVAGPLPDTRFGSAWFDDRIDA